MEINFCDSGRVTISNETGTICLNEDEITRLASLVRDFSPDRLEKVLSEFQEKYRKNALPCVPIIDHQKYL